VEQAFRPAANLIKKLLREEEIGNSHFFLADSNLTSVAEATLSSSFTAGLKACSTLV
jgi:hypothetical protein